MTNTPIAPKGSTTYEPDGGLLDKELSVEELQRRFKATIRKIAMAMLGYDEADDEDGGTAVDEEQIEAWVEAMKKAIAEYHVAAAMLGGDNDPGDWAMSEEQQAKLKNAVKTQLGYFDQFSVRVREDGIFDRAALARAESYAAAVRSTFYQAVTKFLPLPAMPGEGTICHGNCKCGWDIKPVNEENYDFDCYWRRGATDSCSTCIARENEWSPLRIRNGSLI